MANKVTTELKPRPMGAGLEPLQKNAPPSPPRIKAEKKTDQYLQQRGTAPVALQGTHGDPTAESIEAIAKVRPGGVTFGFGSPIEALLARYRIAIVPGRPLERILTSVAKVEQLLAAEGSVSALTEQLVRRDGRRTIFQLEGLLRLYRDRYGAKMEQQYHQVKALEDALGSIGEAFAARRLAEERGAPPPVLAQLDQVLNLARAHAETLIGERWIPGADGTSPGMRELLAQLTGLDWSSTAEDRVEVKAEIADSLKKLSKREYSMDELEEGVHELRRQLRWIPIFIEGLDGLIQLPNNSHPVPEFAPLAEDAEAKAKYRFIPPSEPKSGEQPIEIPQSLYLGLMKTIFELGEVKDNGEGVHLIAEAYRNAGMDPQLAQSLFGPEFASEAITARAQEIYTQLRRTGLLTEFAAALAA